MIAHSGFRDERREENEEVVLSRKKEKSGDGSPLLALESLALHH